MKCRNSCVKGECVGGWLILSEANTPTGRRQGGCKTENSTWIFLWEFELWYGSKCGLWKQTELKRGCFFAPFSHLVHTLHLLAFLLAPLTLLSQLWHTHWEYPVVRCEFVGNNKQWRWEGEQYTGAQVGPCWYPTPFFYCSDYFYFYLHTTFSTSMSACTWKQYLHRPGSILIPGTLRRLLLLLTVDYFYYFNYLWLLLVQYLHTIGGPIPIHNTLPILLFLLIQ